MDFSFLCHWRDNFPQMWQKKNVHLTFCVEYIRGKKYQKVKITDVPSRKYAYKNEMRTFACRYS